ncbi:MAG: hypothetical protein HZC38_14960 [Chloroflexi bacterium]|nr:hypothetical protein [Chloroflexota bacterium]
MKTTYTVIICTTFLLAACGSSISMPKSIGEEVAQPFRDYYNAKGGALVLGTAITPELIEDGIRVQYFQNVRLEYHPQLPKGEQIIPSSIGVNIGGNSTPCIQPLDVAPNAYYFGCHSVRQEFLYQFGLVNLGSQWCAINKRCLSEKIPGNVVTATPTLTPTLPAPSPKGLALRASPEFPLLDIKTQRQTLRAWVTDHSGTPLAGIVVSFLVQYAVNSERYLTNPSDKNGYAYVLLAVKPYKPGDFILYKASASQNGVTVSDHGSFMVFGKP